MSRPTVSGWRSKCPYNFEGDVDDCTPCPHCDADNPITTPSAGHVCEGLICGQALPHDCVGSAQPTADRLDGFALLPDTQVTHGPPRRFNGPTPSTVAAHARALAELHDAAEAPAKRLSVTGCKWPIGLGDPNSPDSCPTSCKHKTFHYCGHSGTHCDRHCVCVCSMCRATPGAWGRRLEAARTHVNLTLDALGAKLNPPRTRKDISAMEHGRRGLSVELCAQLADALDCDRLWLAGWKEGA